MKIYSLVLLFIVSVQIPFTAQAHAAADPEFVVKPYLQYSTKTTIRMLWETTVPAGSRVEYGEAVDGATSPQLNRVQELDGKRLMHEVELTGLKPETNYFWRVVSAADKGEPLVSDTYTFKAVVNDDTAFMFALVGDPQQSSKAPWAWDRVSKKIWQERPNFVVVAGDLVDWGYNKNEWVDEFLEPGHELMSRIPLYTVLGNHEGDADYYYQYMANPPPEYRYTFKYGNAEFFMIDTNKDVSEGSDQYNWLEQQLARSTATWKIAVHHHPPYSAEENDHGETFHGGTSRHHHHQARDLPALYDRFGVDFSLFGHTHVYERTWPLKNNRINQREGTIYINSGGGGGGLEGFAPTRSWFSLELHNAHHYCTFAIYNDTLIFKAVDVDGRLFDTFQINKKTDRDQVEVSAPPAPIVQSQKMVFHNKTTVDIEPGLKGLTVRYTLDGSEPNSRSRVYRKPFQLTKSAEVKARAFTRDGKASRVATRAFTKMAALPASGADAGKRGLSYKLYQGDWQGRQDDFLKKDNLSSQGVLTTLSLDTIESENEYWAIHIEGYLDVPETGTYTFYGIGSRGLSIEVDDMEVVKTDHEQQRTFQLALAKGKHKINIVSFQRNWRKALVFSYYDEITGRKQFKPFSLYH
ncbi:MAG: metallophosphoesterase [Porticoccaceae bacterium]|nr:metallophosphoesterase [Porticoccaceae bacterium]